MREIWRLSAHHMFTWDGCGGGSSVGLRSYWRDRRRANKKMTRGFYSAPRQDRTRISSNGDYLHKSWIEVGKSWGQRFHGFNDYINPQRGKCWTWNTEYLSQGRDSLVTVSVVSQERSEHYFQLFLPKMDDFNLGTKQLVGFFTSISRFRLLEW